LKGLQTTIKDLTLDGTAFAKRGEQLQGEKKDKNYVKFIAASETDPEIFRIRGYNIQKQ